jgi:hypothetical protein
MKRSSIIIAAAAGLAAPALAQNCAGTSTGRVPISDLGTGLYLGQFQGGLYPGGSNVMPAPHNAEGLARAGSFQGLNAAGQPDPAGRIVLISVGMSNTTQEFCSQSSGEPCDPWTFQGRAGVNPVVNRPTVAIVNGAAGGQAAPSWDEPTDPNYNRIRDQVLAPRGLTEAQVQVAWLKVANAQPGTSLPAQNADAFTLVQQTGNILRAMKTRWPNLRMVFISTRIYAGYATSSLNPEPYAYESGLAAKWVIQAQIQQMAGGGADPRAGDLNYGTVAPWVAWGPYLWADGTTPRSDGLVWVCSDFSPDGTHPATPGRSKVGGQLMEFFLTSPFTTPWFGRPCYPNCDNSTQPPSLNVLDFNCFLNRFAAGHTDANCDASTQPPILNILDFSCFLNRFAAGCGE